MDESDLSVLWERAESADKGADDQLIELADEQGNLDELRHLADQGNTTANEMLGSWKSDDRCRSSQLAAR